MSNRFTDKDRKVRIVLLQSEGTAETHVRDGLEAAPGISLVGCTTDIDEAMRLAMKERPDLVLLEQNSDSWTNAIRTISEGAERASVLLVVAGIDEEEAVEAVKAGAQGVVAATTTSRELSRTLRGVAFRGEIALPRPVAARVIRSLGDEQKRLLREFRPIYGELTDREWEFLHLVAEGCTIGGAADRLGVTTETMRTHAKNVRKKLGTRTTREAARQLDELKRKALASARAGSTHSRVDLRAPRSMGEHD